MNRHNQNHCAEMTNEGPSGKLENGIIILLFHFIKFRLQISLKLQLPCKQRSIKFGIYN